MATSRSSVGGIASGIASAPQQVMSHDGTELESVSESVASYDQHSEAYSRELVT